MCVVLVFLHAFCVFVSLDVTNRTAQTASCRGHPLPGHADESTVRWGWGRLARSYLIGGDNSRDQIHKPAARWR